MTRSSSDFGNSGNYRKHTSGNPLQRQLIARFHRRVLELTILTGSADALEVGCGEGFALRYLGERLPAVRLRGLDINPGAVAVARRLAPAIPVAVGDVADLPCPSDSTDLVLCLEVLEHLAEPRRALAEIRRVTRRHVILSVPNEPWFRLANLARGKNLSRWGDDPEHRQHWSGPEFADLVADYFLIQRVESCFPWTIALAERRS